MPKLRIVVNGYSLPWGFSGVAVRRACELVLSQPGIPQSELMEKSAYFANISTSNSTWLVSPGEKSPALKLWHRERSGKRFLCYPNEFTSELIGAHEARAFEWTSRHRNHLVQGDIVPKEGDIVEVKFGKFSHYPQSWVHALFLGWNSGSGAKASTLVELGEKVEHRYIAQFSVLLDGKCLTSSRGKVRACK